MNLYADYTFYVSISIHTPAKGVTYPKCLSGIREAISIHTPAKGVTNNLGILCITLPISIHTPAKGVTISHKYSRIEQ